MRTVVVCEVEDVLFAGRFWMPFIRRQVEARRLRGWLWRHKWSWLASFRSPTARVLFCRRLWDDTVAGLPYGYLTRSLLYYTGHSLRWCEPTLYRSLEARIKAGDTVYIVSTSVSEWADRLFSTFRPKVLADAMEHEQGQSLPSFSDPLCMGEEALRRFREAEPERADYRLVVYATARNRPLLDEADEAHRYKRRLWCRRREYPW